MTWHLCVFASLREIKMEIILMDDQVDASRLQPTSGVH
jgi:hypothetical protein